MTNAFTTTISSSTSINGVLVVWFILSILSVVYVAYDAFTNNPELKVMRWGWIVVTAYTGVIGAALYALSCTPPKRKGHPRFVSPIWKQALGSTIHCLSGDVTGIIVASVITALLRFPLYIDTVSEYFFGFVLGLLIFQALFEKKMLGGSYLQAIQKTFLPEWVSMNMVMAGAIPIMVILQSRNPQAMKITNIEFWGIWSLATLVALATSYPVNVWLVVSKLKHGMGTEAVLGKGGHPISMEK